MLARNVHHDFRRFLVECGLMGAEFITGVEQHKYRDVLHLHAIIGGDFDDPRQAAPGKPAGSATGATQGFCPFSTAAPPT